MTTTTLSLFDLASLRPEPPEVPCMWHLDRAATHRVVIAVNMLHPRWGRLQGDSARGPVPLDLHVVGSGRCAECVTRRTGSWLHQGTVQYFVPLTAEPVAR